MVKLNKMMYAAFAAVVAVLCVVGLSACSGTSNNSNAAANDSQSSNESQKVQVVASFYPMADFAQKIGGEHVGVTNLCPAGTEPHEWEPSPSDVKAIEGADVFVYNGADMEGWVSDTLASSNLHGAVVCASDGINLRLADHSYDVDGTDEGEHAGEHDPHVWLAPENAKKEAENIKDALVKADPDNASEYEANYTKWAGEFDSLDKEFSEQLSQASGKTIVVSHETFGYLCDAYGLTQEPITGMDAEGEPDAKAMAEIVRFVRDHNVKVIFSEDLVSPKVAQQIADETSASCEVLNPVEGLEQDELDAGEDYFSVMRDNLKELVSALNQQ
ncbi:metal ABC transporter substrate-binding protein [uncultured Senegalimassilia sp.]|uniref:metal ABC transporter substrate-binding protein n=1 Tax=uncultured Senegalimassilia sp. TaxID=1714350 RepID=UPI0025D1E928|nr:metal ABC transporter substrate-binding protein [uncultured Senegalimassilia sp.]